MMDKKLLWEILLVRITMAFLSQTWYVPDETWQSVEVSHSLVYGSGFLHPLLFSLPLFQLKNLGMDSQTMVVLAPKIFQGIITGLCEYSLVRGVTKVEGGRVGYWFFLLTIFNWHSLYTCSRTLINTLEYSLTCLALSFYIHDSKDKTPSYVYLPIIALCFMLRPTSALVWAPLVLLHLYKMFRSGEVWRMFVWLAASVGVVCVCVLVESCFYGRLTVPPINFFLINVYKNLGVNYGTHPWHWYLTNALPTMLGPLLIPLIQGFHRSSLTLILPIFVNVVFLSALQHKEMRFLASSFPFFLLIISKQINQYSSQCQRMLKVFFLVSNVLVCGYLSLVHQRGVVDAALWIGQKGSDIARAEGQPGVLFLMPCHSTPLYSHIHYNMYTRFLGCEPNLSGQPGYTEEAERFYSDPATWLRHIHDDPDMVVLFDTLEPEIGDYLSKFWLCESFKHTHFPEGKVGNRVNVYCRKWS